MSIAVVILLISLFCCDVNGYGLRQKTLVVSFDGFAQSYFDNNRFLPWFSYFRKTGVYSDQVRSIFPSSTFPNHWSIVTGMYAESHGIVANAMYDPNLNGYFTLRNNDSVWWNQAEPIWVTAKKKGIKTAVSFWAGGDVAFPGGHLPDYYWKPYNESIPFEKRINEVIELMSNKGVDLALVYFHLPDHEAHIFGPNSENAATALKLADWYLSYLLKRLDYVGLGKDKLNIVLCADHGMATVTEQLFLDDYIDISANIERVCFGIFTTFIASLLQIFQRKLPYTGPYVSLQPKEGKLDFVY